MISVYSRLSAVVFFNISMLAVYLLRRKTGFLAAYTAPVLRFLILLGAVRLFLPLDVENAWVIASPELLPFMHGLLHVPLVPGVLSLGGALMGVWLFTAAALVIFGIHRQLGEFRARREYRVLRDERVARAAEKLNCPCPVLVSEDVSEPFAAGILHPEIFLPPLDLSDRELELVLRHEIQHIRSLDLYKKAVFIFLAELFWWNPAMWAFVREIDALQELDCDRRLVDKMNKAERVEYLNTQLKVLRRAAGSGGKLPLCSSALADGGQNMRLRFSAVLCRGRRRSRAERALLGCLFTALFLLSYFVIFLPEGSPRADQYGCGACIEELSLDMALRDDVEILER